ncbi:uncharacterized protein LOC129716852 [Wyeomyia smithii]|uniref:uncharacterized protein LOC129716852 n=1 Tax=Wyeomyia smithii TaxID=174621 RepID=UPI00246802DB|nr:uncharacterized protein LOC129716852 [Wyeomyia smithii]
MLWDPKGDNFIFSKAIRSDLQQYIQEGAWPTKRIVLKCIASMFDPKQFLAPLLIQGRIFMQDLWRSGIGWDDKVTKPHYERWIQWTRLLYLIEAIKVPRCYLGGLSSTAYESVQLHVFTDAGEAAYGSVAYFRFEQAGVVHCAFVEAKAKVALLEYLSTPRMELEAATHGASLVKTICEGHSFPISKRYLWCDSDTVVTWVKSDQRKFKPFVAHRIGKILSLTNHEEWRWVGTKENPADDLTKWGKETEIKSRSRWFLGPEFLYQDESKWPKQKRSMVENTKELRASVLLHHISLPGGLEKIIERVSRWTVMVRTVATMYRFVSNCRRRKMKMEIEVLPIVVKRTKGAALSATVIPLRQEEYKLAETLLWRIMQAEAFADEVKTLVKNKDSPANQELLLEKSSPIYRLSQFLDEDNVLRMEGRTEAADYVVFDVRFPIILPKNHAATRKLVMHYHRQYGHGSRETVVNELRQRYYIPCVSALVDQVMRECMWCKVRKSKPFVPRMAPLPGQRLAARLDPFSNVGIDYFGPIEVSVGRRKEKRWVALFTCLTVRAVHLEVAYSLTTESCKMAIRRFVKWRGSPREIFSDNGTNFVGANRELLKEINIACADTFTGAKTQWSFNPPSAPHMGGAWERMKLTDEVLHTALIEAENLINSRPITYVSTNVKEDKEALTPNHFLRGRSSVECLPSRNPERLAETLQSSYSNAQQLADGFWERWQHEYLPTLNKRTKWFVDQRNVAIGDLVFVADGEKRYTWERGIVTKVLAGTDGRIRSASVRTSRGEKLRPVSRLAVLEVEMEQSKPILPPREAVTGFTGEGMLNVHPVAKGGSIETPVAKGRKIATKRHDSR